MPQLSHRWNWRESCVQSGRERFLPDVTRSGRFLELPSSERIRNVVETASIDLVMKGESVDLTRGDSNIFFRVKRRGVSDREQEGRPSSGAS